MKTPGERVLAQTGLCPSVAIPLDYSEADSRLRRETVEASKAGLNWRIVKAKKHQRESR